MSQKKNTFGGKAEVASNIETTRYRFLAPKTKALFRLLCRSMIKALSLYLINVQAITESSRSHFRSPMIESPNPLADKPPSWKAKNFDDRPAQEKCARMAGFFLLPIYSNQQKLEKAHPGF